MFIPDTIKGRNISLLRELKVPGGTFTIGHVFKVTSIGPRGLNLEDYEGRRVIEVADFQENKDYRIVAEFPSFVEYI